MLRLACLSCLFVCVLAFMPIMPNNDIMLRDLKLPPLRCLPQNSSLHSELVPIATHMSGTQIHTLLALMTLDPTGSIKSANYSSTVDIWRRLWMEFGQDSYLEEL